MHQAGSNKKATVDSNGMGGLSKSFFVVYLCFLGAGFSVGVLVKTVGFEREVFEASVPLQIVRAEEEPEARLLFVGDIMLDRTIRREGESNGYPFLFSCVKEELTSYDAVIGNLEGPVTTYPTVSLDTVIGSPENKQFTFAPESLSALREANISIVSLGNNHTLNFGNEGLVQTRTHLTDADIDFFGDPRDATHRVFTTSVGDVPIAFVVFNEFSGGLEETKEDIATLRDDFFVVVFAHWGDEYMVAPARVKTWARAFVDLGADLVVGAHPHVVQESEVYQGVPIYYSLGNFMFDQYWNESVRNGLALEVVLGRDGVEAVVERPVELLRDRRTCFATSTALTI